MATKTTKVNLFDFYEGITDTFNNKRTKLVPHKAYPAYKKKGYKIPPNKFKNLPEGYYFDSPIKPQPSIDLGDIAIDSRLLKCPKLGFKDQPLYPITLDIASIAEKLSCAFSKNNDFTFTLWNYNQDWDYIQVRSSYGGLQIGRDFYIPRWWGNSTFKAGYVNMCADQQDFLTFPSQARDLWGAGIYTNRYVNILLKRDYPVISGSRKTEYAIIKLGVSNDSQQVFFLPYFMFGFEQTLVANLSPYVKLHRIYDIESMPGIVYLVGHVLLTGSLQAIRLFKIKQGQLDSFVDVCTIHHRGDKTLITDEVRVSVDHSVYNKGGQISVVVLVGGKVFVVSEGDTGMSVRSSFNLPLEIPESREWYDIIANCGH